MDYRLKDPEDMTPEERRDRIVEILADAVVRLILRKRGETGRFDGASAPKPGHPGSGFDSHPTTST